MKIYLIGSTINRYGGGLKGGLEYFDQLIRNELTNAGFQSSYDDIRIILCYPPVNPISETAERKNGFADFYASLPYSRLYSKTKRAEITLKAPEFVLQFDGKEWATHRNKVDEKIINLADTELAHMLIDKYIEAGKIISSKLKKGEVFDFTQFEKILLSIRSKISAEYLKQLTEDQELSSHSERLEHIESKREERKKLRLPQDTLIRDIRISFSWQLPQNLRYLNRYADIVLKQLIQKDFKCPHYHHLYISVANTKEEALEKAIEVEDWYIYGVAVIKEEDLLQAESSAQQELVLQAIEEGLLDIADLDGLDKSKIKSAIREAREMGILAEVVLIAKENKKIVFIISTRAIINKNEEEIYFTVIDKDADKAARWKFGEESIFLIRGWFGTINVTNKKIKTKPRANMGLVLKGKQECIEIDVAEVLNDPEKMVIPT